MREQPRRCGNEWLSTQNTSVCVGSAQIAANISEFLIILLTKNKAPCLQMVTCAVHMEYFHQTLTLSRSI